MLNKQYNFVRVTALEVCKLLSTLDYVGKGRTVQRTGLNMPLLIFMRAVGPILHVSTQTIPQGYHSYSTACTTGCPRNVCK